MIQMRWLPSFLLILGIVTLPAFGQSIDLRVNVPFAFNVAQAKLPAGDYVLSSANGKIAVRDSRGRTVALALANPSGKAADTTGRAVFECYGDRCFLSQFWSAGEHRGNRLVRSSTETKIAAEQTGQYFAVLAAPARR